LRPVTPEWLAAYCPHVLNAAKRCVKNPQFQPNFSTAAESFNFFQHELQEANRTKTLNQFASSSQLEQLAAFTFTSGARCRFTQAQASKLLYYLNFVYFEIRHHWQFTQLQLRMLKATTSLNS
jgi:hypothetical protein